MRKLVEIVSCYQCPYTHFWSERDIYCEKLKKDVAVPNDYEAFIPNFCPLPDVIK